MKELSTEEKAKAYDEAIKVAESIHRFSSDPAEIKRMEQIFPELEESEDERIRKALVEMVHDTTGDSLWVDYNVHKEDALAWLEKQGEQKLVQETEPTPIFKIGDILKRKGKDYTFRVDRIQGGYYHCDRNHGAFFPIEEQGLWQLVAQKPAWSEDDEFELECVLGYLRNYLHEDSYIRYENWLKSLKERVQPQPKHEWSEEDKIIIGVLNELVDATPYKDFHNATKYDCINFLRTIEKKVFPQPQQELNKEDLYKIEHALIDTYAMDSASKILNKIKSLRPQTTWKPSEEQMVALDGICSYIRNKADWEISQDMVSDLYKLSEQLKKLREE